MSTRPADPAADPAANPAADTAAEPPVRLEDGAVAIAGRPVLRSIDLTVRTGEFVALMGANGSGKSTLVRTLVGLRPLTSGRLRLFGTELDRFHAWSRVGFVPQRVGAASGVPASVAEVVAAGRLTHRRLFWPMARADRDAVTDALEVVGLADRARDGVGTLSGGQQQRVLIARALAGRPELFFLDEPTAGVDLPNQQALATALAALHNRGATIVLVAHELGPLAPLVHRAVVMRDGRIVHDGAPLADHEVHDPFIGEAHTHHHDHDGGYADHGGHGGGRSDPHATRPGGHTHAPHLQTPLDRGPGSGR